jgi:hypothetical protein
MERKLGIGTAQFGLDYGISNQHAAERPPERGGPRILADASAGGACAGSTRLPRTGRAKRCLGEVLWPAHGFRCDHKDVPRLADLLSEARVRSGSRICAKRILRSRFCKLGQERLVRSALPLLPRTCSARAGKELFDAAMELKEPRTGWSKVGVSVYTAAEIDAGLRPLRRWTWCRFRLSVLDQRLLAEPATSDTARQATGN